MKNPEQIKETWLERIQRRQSKEIAKQFFLTYTTQEEITKKIYPRAYVIRKKQSKRNFVMPLITSRVKEWRKYGFFDKSVPLKKEIYRKGKKHKQTFYLSLLNLEPIYKFCKEEKHIEFTEEEKSYLKLLLLSEKIREIILKEYPEEDVINAVLKFYVKNLIMKYFYLMKNIRENPKKYKKEETRAEELNKPTTEEGKRMKRIHGKLQRELYKKYAPNKSYKKTDFDIIKIIAMNEFHKDLTNPIRFLFNSYINHIEDNKELIASTDRKILTAFNLQPLEL